MASTAELIAQLYIGFYNRAPDPVGLQYWLGRVAAGVSIQDIADSFAASPEASENYQFFNDPGADVDGFLGQVYLHVFGRPIDDDGLAYYKARLETGEPAGSVVASILGNADTNTGSPDQAYLQNKVDAGLYWAQQAAKSGVEIYDANGRLTDAADASAHGIIETVTSDPGSVGGSKGGTDDFFHPAEPQPEPEPQPGGGDGGGGGTSIPPAKFGDLTATFSDGILYAGTNNPATGFMIASDTAGTMELGLDFRYRGNDTDIVPVNGKNLYIVDPMYAADARFAYSVSGIDLSTYEYKLEIDTNPGKGRSWETFTLVADDVVEPHTYNNHDSAFDWVRTIGGAIEDDGGDADGNVTQNIQAIHWYNDGSLIQAGDAYDVRLTAIDKSTGKDVAATAITVKGINAEMTSTVSGKVASTEIPGLDGTWLYAGKGNPADNFATVEFGKPGSVIELGLSGRIKGDFDVPEGALDKDGLVKDGLVHFTFDAGENVRFAYSIESEQLLSANTFKLYLDIDPTNAVNYKVFTLTEFDRDSNTAAPGQNAENSQYRWVLDGDESVQISDDGGDAGGYITQNIQNIAWYDDNPAGELVTGRYDVGIVAYDVSGTTIIGYNHIVLDVLVP